MSTGQLRSDCQEPDAQRYAASAVLDGTSIVRPEILPAVRIAPRASFVIGNNPATALVVPI